MQISLAHARPFVLACAACLVALAATRVQAATDPLPSWNDGAAKSRIVSFVQAVIDPTGKDYVAPGARVAVFDNDGTLWTEQPIYFQAAFALDTVKAMAAKDPALAANPAIAAAAKGNLKALGEVIAITHANTTSDEFAERVRQWTKTARHPTLNRPYTELTFKPMRELLDYLEANGFSTWIARPANMFPSVSCSAKPMTTAPTADVVRNFSCITTVATTRNSPMMTVSWTMIGNRSGTRSARSGLMETTTTRLIDRPHVAASAAREN